MITEWDGPDVEDYGLLKLDVLGPLKLDVLGLRNLDVISFTTDYIQATKGETVDPDSVDPTWTTNARAPPGHCCAPARLPGSSRWSPRA